MIDHLSLGVGDVPAAIRFYDRVLATLGYHRLALESWGAAYGKDRPVFLLMRPYDGRVATNGNGTHLALVAESPAQVDAFHAAALAAGGRDAGAPGPRPALGEKAYVAYAFDPFGHKLEAIHGGFAGA